MIDPIIKNCVDIVVLNDASTIKSWIGSNDSVCEIQYETLNIDEVAKRAFVKILVVSCRISNDYFISFKGFGKPNKIGEVLNYEINYNNLKRLIRNEKLKYLENEQF